MSHNVMKAVQRLAGQAAQAVEDETNEQLQRMQESAAAKQMQQLYWATTTTANTTTAANTWLSYSALLGTAPTLGGGVPYQYQPTTTTGYTTYYPNKPTIEFTPEQMTSFMAKLADLLTKGWECLRCHRIWNPQVTGCEFCNFIDRLEGKDVERDDAA